MYRYSRYFLIPIFDSLIHIKISDGNFLSLADYTRKYLPSLDKLNKERIGAIWINGDFPLSYNQQNTINTIEKKIKEKANQKKIPLFVLAGLAADGKVYEPITNQRIFFDESYMLKVRECNRSVFNLYLEPNSNYSLYIRNFFNRKNFKLIKCTNEKILKKN